MKIPIAYNISQWGSATEILYCCPNCETSFSILGKRNKFCYNCGIEIQWHNVLLNVDKDIAEKYHNNYNEQKEIILNINKKNMGGTNK